MSVRRRWDIAKYDKYDEITDDLVVKEILDDFPCACAGAGEVMLAGSKRVSIQRQRLRDSIYRVRGRIRRRVYSVPV